MPGGREDDVVSTIRPALTAEEWENDWYRFGDPWGLRLRLDVDGGIPLVRFEYRGNDMDYCGVLSPESARIIVALLMRVLRQQGHPGVPTWETVDMLREVAETHRAESCGAESVDDVGGDWLEDIPGLLALADFLASLFPPRED